MVTGKPQQQQQGVVAAAEPSVARRLWRVVRAVLYMLRRGLPSGRKLAMDLHLLVHRGKIAGKALGDLFLASHHGHGHARHAAAATFSYARSGAGAAGPFSCRALDPSQAVHEPSRGRREVEFSCSNTPSSASGGGALGLLGAAKRRRRRNRQQQQRDEAAAAAGNGYLQYYSCYQDDVPEYSYDYDAAEVARVFEMLNDSDDDAVPLAYSVTPSPAQAQLLYLQAAVGSSRQQQARIARSPAPADGAHPQQVDRMADDFIRRFYEQLRAQRSAASTPDYYGYSAGTSPYGTARTPRRATAGIA